MRKSSKWQTEKLIQSTKTETKYFNDKHRTLKQNTKMLRLINYSMTTYNIHTTHIWSTQYRVRFSMQADNVIVLYHFMELWNIRIVCMNKRQKVTLSILCWALNIGCPIHRCTHHNVFYIEKKKLENLFKQKFWKNFCPEKFLLGYFFVLMRFKDPKHPNKIPESPDKIPLNLQKSTKTWI